MHLIRTGRARLVALLLLAATPAIGADEVPRLAPDATTFTLDNGLTVLVIPDHRAPVVTHMVWYKVGSADEPRGRSGVAHFLEHLMFKGTALHPAGEFSGRIQEIGGNENAFTTPDTTAYHQTVAREFLPLMMELEADRMTNLVLSDEVVLPERDVILEERRARIDNDPAAQLAEAVNAALYRNSPYASPTIGWEHEMAALDRQYALEFYSRYYTPNNAILVVAGDVTVDEVRRLTADTWAKVPRRAEPPPRDWAQEPPSRVARTVTMADARVTQPSWQRVYLVPSYRTSEEREAFALDLLVDIVGSGPTSRLYRKLVVETGVAASAGAYYAGSAYGYGRLAFFGIPREVGLPELEAAFDAVIADVRDNGVTADELARAKRRVLAGAVYAQDSQAAMGRLFGQGLANGMSLEWLQTFPAALQEVTLDEVNAAARKYFDIRRSVTGYLTAAPETRS